MQEVYCDEFPNQDPLMADVNADADNDPELDLGEDLEGFGMLIFERPVENNDGLKEIRSSIS